MISFDEFKRLDLRTATVVSAERVAESEKLVKLEVAAGDRGADGGSVTRQIVAGIGKAYNPDSLVGKTIVIVANLESKKLMGLESNGMLLAASDTDSVPVLLVPDREVLPGSSIS